MLYQIDGQGFSVTFINKFGETETFSSEGGFCQLTKVSLTGPAAVCLGSGSSRYIASLVSTGFISPIFDWIIDANGCPNLQIHFATGALSLIHFGQPQVLIP
jgi:hypothetical protein